MARKNKNTAEFEHSADINSMEEIYGPLPWREYSNNIIDKTSLNKGMTADEALKRLPNENDCSTVKLDDLLGNDFECNEECNHNKPRPWDDDYVDDEEKCDDTLSEQNIQKFDDILRQINFNLFIIKKHKKRLKKCQKKLKSVKSRRDEYFDFLEYIHENRDYIPKFEAYLRKSKFLKEIFDKNIRGLDEREFSLQDKIEYLESTISKYKKANRNLIKHLGNLDEYEEI